MARFLIPHFAAPAMLCLLSLAFGQVHAQAARPELTRLERVIQAQEIRVCIWPAYYGITYRNPKTRQLSGLDIDMAVAFAQELGVRLRYVDSSFVALIDNLLANRCDIAMHAVGVSPDRSAHLAFSQPYLRSDVYAVTTAQDSVIKTWGDIDKPGRIIAVQAGTFMEPVMQKALKHAQLLVVSPPMTRENEVESGRADAFMTDFAYSQRMLDLTDWARVVGPTRPFHPTDYAYALAPGDRSLLERTNRFVDRIRADGRLQQIAARHKLTPMLIQQR